MPIDRWILRRLHGRRVQARPYEGVLVETPKVGLPIVIVYAPGGCVVTSRVQRILCAVGERRQFVVTENSTYELRIASAG